ncbi:MAG: CBS and ACT domain-containing protein [Proteobacteria bacterium]|nr:CBS and ACT domain-containing protein [Pseudomonadota bacterium]
MLVNNWMNREIVTLDAGDSMNQAVKFLRQETVSLLPVLDKGKLVGVVTDRDVKRASASESTSLKAHELSYITDNIKVREIMTRKPITVPWDYAVEEAAELLLKHKISGAPVVGADGGLIGTISQADLFKAIIALTGLEKRGIKFGLVVEDRPGAVKEMEEAIRKYGGRVASIMTSYNDVPAQHRKVHIRMYEIDRKQLARLKEELATQARLLYMVDLREGLREVY